MSGTVDWLQNLLHPHAISVAEGTDGLRVTLPKARGADYGFEYQLYRDGRREIRAVLSGGEQQYFWSRLFSLEDHLSLRELERSANACLRALLASETRIRQRRGLFFTSFLLSRRRGSTWVKVSSAGVFRSGKHPVPPMASRERIYLSTALLSA